MPLKLTLQEVSGKTTMFWKLEKSMLLLLSRFGSVRLCAAPQMAAHQAPLSTGFSRQEYWSGLPFPSLRKKYDSNIKKE